MQLVYLFVRKCVRNRIGLKLILGLAIIAAGTLASYYANVLWLNNVTLAVVAVLAVGWIWGAMYGAVVRKELEGARGYEKRELD